MRAPFRLLLLCPLLLLPVAFLHPAAASAAVSTLAIDANHRLTTGAIFTPGEQIALWFDVPGGSAGALSLATTGSVNARSDGTLDVTITASDWNSIARSAVDLVAYGLTSQVAAVGALNPPAGLDLSLHLDANQRLTSAMIFTPGEQVVFWYNKSDLSAAPFDPTGYTVYADANGALGVTIGSYQFANLPTNVTSIVAHGFYSNVNAVYVFPAH